MDDVLIRIKTVMENEGLSPSELADKIDIGRPLLSHVMSGRNKPSLQLILKILNHFPAYSADWILLGREAIGQVDTTKEKTPELKQEETVVDNPIKPEDPVVAKNTKSTPSGLPEVVLMMYEDKSYEAYKLRK